MWRHTTRGSTMLNMFTKDFWNNKAQLTTRSDHRDGIHKQRSQLQRVLSTKVAKLDLWAAEPPVDDYILF